MNRAILIAAVLVIVIAAIAGIYLYSLSVQPVQNQTATQAPSQAAPSNISVSAAFNSTAINVSEITNSTLPLNITQEQNYSVLSGANLTSSP